MSRVFRVSTRKVKTANCECILPFSIWVRLFLNLREIEPTVSDRPFLILKNACNRPSDRYSHVLGWRFIEVCGWVGAFRGSTLVVDWDTQRICSCKSSDVILLMEIFLQAKHAETGSVWWGIDGEKGTIEDMKELGIWDCYSVKVQTLKTAMEVSSSAISYLLLDSLFHLVLLYTFF